MKILLLMLLVLSPFAAIIPQSTDSLNSAAVISDTSRADSLRSAADSLKLAKSRPVIPLFPQGISYPGEEQNIISRREIIYNYYRYTGDLLDLFPLAFQRSTGIMGQPHEVMLYGNGINNVSYLTDGMLQNNRFTNSLDLNYIQSESMDSIEIVPAPRSFLYGIYNNPAAVNFVPRENYSLDSKQGPYSRLRYYQAPDEEAMIDATYRTYLARKLTGIFELTNYSTSGRYINSSHGSWKLRTDLSYLLSDKFNLKAGYNYNRTETRLFGGINTDSLDKLTAEGLEMQDFEKPVMFPTRYQKYHQHQFNLMLRNNEFLNLSGKIDLYYISSLTEQRQNEKILSTTKESYYNGNLKNKIYGIRIDQTYRNNLLDLRMFASSEYLDYKNYAGYINNSIQVNGGFSTSALSGRLILKLLDNILRPSVFSKYLFYDNKGFFGTGADISLDLNKYFSLYGGSSHFTRPRGYGSIETTEITSYELGALAKADILQAGIKVFDQEFKNHMFYFEKSGSGQFNLIDKSIQGLGLDLKLALWKIHLESNAAYYKNDMSVLVKAELLPEYNVRSKLFYQDTLFNSNLFLRTGFSAQYTGTGAYINYGFSMIPTYNDNYESLSPVFRIDYFLTGEIRRRAIIYFTFENILNREDYIVPGYPLPAAGIRLGVSWEFLN